jgi:hypothetical protein
LGSREIGGNRRVTSLWARMAEEGRKGEAG